MGAGETIGLPSRRPTPFALAVSALTLFTFGLNVGFPLVSDDFCHLNTSARRGSFGSVSYAYHNWTARSGELLMLAGGRLLDGLIFDVLNAAAMAGILVLGFRIVFGRPGSDLADAVAVVALFTMVSASTVFGAAFLWRAGALNYAWALLLVVAHFVPYRTPFDQTDRGTPGPLVVAGLVVLGFLAGMSSFDLGALGVLVHAALYWRRRGRTTALHLDLPAITYAAGFAALYFAPGTGVRAEQMPGYRSLGSLLDSAVSGELVELMRYSLTVIGYGASQTNHLALVAAAVLFVGAVRTGLRDPDPSLLRRSALGFVLFAVGLYVILAGGPIDRWTVMGIGLICTFIMAVGVWSGRSKSNRSDQDLSDRDRDAAPTVESEATSATRTFRTQLGLFSILLLDLAMFTVGIVPAQRAYLPAAALAAVIVLLAVRPVLRRRPAVVLVAVAFVGSASVLSIQVAGERVNANALDRTIATSVEGGPVVADQATYWVDLPQFYSWTPLSETPTFWANVCMADYHGIDSISLPGPHRVLEIGDFIDELTR